MSKPNLTAEDVRRLFHYDPDTGIFTRKINRHRYRAGEVAGYECHGYIRIKIIKPSYSAHRLAWLYVYGAWPDGEIDHINGITNDNRIVNLRSVAHSQNIENLHKARSDNKSGLLGVSWSHKSWIAQIQVNGEKKYLGRHKTKEDAHEAYLVAKRLLHVACSI